MSEFDIMRTANSEQRPLPSQFISNPSNLSKEIKGDSFPVKVAKVLKRKIKRVQYGRDTLSEFFLFFIDQSSRVLFKKNPHFYSRRKVKQFSELIKDDAYYIKDAKLPVLDDENQNVFFAYVFEDTFYSYLYLDDRYDEKTVDECDVILYEGLYGLQNDLVDVTVRAGDIVIDAGSWIGDFAAYASAKGASVYAFEPLEPAFGYLERTAELNGNITPVKKGISDKSTKANMFVDACNTGASSFLENMCVTGTGEAAAVETTTIDQFVKDMGLERVDFIKADIEGFERYMLMGAQETLKKFAPKLALCTYHLPDDPEVMASLIKQANPDYNIIQKSKKLYASVNK